MGPRRRAERVFGGPTFAAGERRRAKPQKPVRPTCSSRAELSTFSRVRRPSTTATTLNTRIVTKLLRNSSRTGTAGSSTPSPVSQFSECWFLSRAPRSSPTATTQPSNLASESTPLQPPPAATIVVAQPTRQPPHPDSFVGEPVAVDDAGFHASGGTECDGQTAGGDSRSDPLHAVTVPHLPHDIFEHCTTGQITDRNHRQSAREQSTTVAEPATNKPIGRRYESLVN